MKWIGKLSQICILFIVGIGTFQNCSLTKFSIMADSIEDPVSAVALPLQPPSLGVGHDTIVVAGQSNAVGFGIASNGDLGADDSFDSKILQIGRMREVGHNLKVLPLTEFIDSKQIKHKFLEHWGVWTGWNLYGFAITFARDYARSRLSKERKLLIVPAACAGSSITEWNLNKTCATSPSEESLYVDMIARAKYAMNQPGANRIVAFLWQQGETDVGMPQTVYGENLVQLFQRVRSDLVFSSNAPILAGTMVPNWLKGTPSHANKLALEGEMRNVLSQNSFGGVVESAGLLGNYESQLTNVQEDAIHFSAASQVELGHRYFFRWLELMH